MFAKALLGDSLGLLGSCCAVAGVLLENHTPLLTETQTLFANLIQSQCFGLFISNVRKF